MRFARILLLGLLALAGALLVPGPAHSQVTIVVDSTGDGGDNNIGNGLCNDGTGACTLRAAIQEANALAGLNDIAFGIGGIVDTITPASPLPTITDPIWDKWRRPARRPPDYRTEREQCGEPPTG